MLVACWWTFDGCAGCYIVLSYLVVCVSFVRFAAYLPERHFVMLGESCLSYLVRSVDASFENAASTEKSPESESMMVWFGRDVSLRGVWGFWVAVLCLEGLGGFALGAGWWFGIFGRWLCFGGALSGFVAVLLRGRSMVCDITDPEPGIWGRRSTHLLGPLETYKHCLIAEKQ